ncbi:MAG: LPXTG cell wall anchor domain-containing protein, partial [Actinomycetota bacterium]
GTDGYEVSVEVTVEEIEEIIDDPSAEFSVLQAQTAAGVITADDIPEPTPTTEPPATTAAPTTAAPTTPPPAPPTTLAAELPATGTTSQTLPILVVALALLGIGAVAVGATRRS